MFVFCTHSLGACLEPKDRSSHENVSCDRGIAAEHIEEAACYTCRGIFIDMESAFKQARKKLVSDTRQIFAAVFVIICCYVFIEACTTETNKNTLATKLLMATTASMHL